MDSSESGCDRQLDSTSQLPNRITIKVTGGLGNQLWQYIAGLALQAKHADAGELVELHVDTTCFRIEKKRKFLLPKLLDKQAIRITKANPSYPVYKEPQEFVFDSEFFDTPPAITLEGYFQHYRYFELARPHLHLRFAPMPKNYCELEQKYELVALHVRRGDYLQEYISLIHGLAPLGYYRAALRAIRKQVQNPYILLLSDDVPWVTEHLVADMEALHLPYSFPYNNTKGNTIDDFSIMAQCRHFIIGNSSYSALVALLGAKPDSIVFMPQLWNLSQNVCSQQILPPSWQTPTYMLYEGSASEQPAVSLIIPVYNTEAYLVRCLESVCRQTEQNIEIIIIDDASPDNSWSIIQDYATRDSRIRAIRHPQNKHLGGARNTGIEAARAEWLLFLDSDDYLRLDAVEILLNASKECAQLELIICGFWHVLPKGQLMPSGKQSSKVKLLPDTFREYCTGKNFDILHCTWGKLWQRSLFENIRFPEHMSVEDFPITPCLFAQLQAGKTLVLPERLFMYQYRRDSSSNHFTEQSAKDFGRVFVILQEFAAQLAPERRHLLEKRMQREFHSILQRKQSQDSEFQIALVEHIPKDLLAKSLWELSSKLQQDSWYRFGQLSRKRKLWAIGKVLSKKLGIYRRVQPLARWIKPILEEK